MNSIFGRPQQTSAEKIAAVEQEMRLFADLHNRYVLNVFGCMHLLRPDDLLVYDAGMPC